MKTADEQRAERTAAVIAMIAAERQRQVNVEGFTPLSDATNHVNGRLARAAACYALHTSTCNMWDSFVSGIINSVIAKVWPFAAEWWKPKDKRRDLVRAAALIVAELELDLVKEEHNGR